jgi:hypothetical protein
MWWACSAALLQHGTWQNPPSRSRISLCDVFRRSSAGPQVSMKCWAILRRHSSGVIQVSAPARSDRMAPPRSALTRLAEVELPPRGHLRLLLGLHFPPQLHAARHHR